jgi:hypothetical protein
MRVFNVRINGASSLQNFDVFAQAGRRLHAVDRTFSTSVPAGRLSIAFQGVVDLPIINRPRSRPRPSARPAARRATRAEP